MQKFQFIYYTTKKLIKYLSTYKVHSKIILPKHKTADYNKPNLKSNTVKLTYTSKVLMVENILLRVEPIQIQ